MKILEIQSRKRKFNQHFHFQNGSFTIGRRTYWEISRVALEKLRNCLSGWATSLIEELNTQLQVPSIRWMAFSKLPPCCVDLALDQGATYCRASVANPTWASSEYPKPAYMYCERAVNPGEVSTSISPHTATLYFGCFLIWLDLLLDYVIVHAQLDYGLTFHTFASIT